MIGAPDDESLLAAARAGDRAALESLLERWQPRIFRFGLKMCGDPDDAREILQETLLAAARGLRDFRGAASVTTWLYSIARSFCIRARRSTGVAGQPSVPLDSAVARAVHDPGRGPEESVAAREITRALSAGIASLDPSQREILLLRDVEGLTAPQVSEITDLSVEAVKSRLHRARLALRESLAPLVGPRADGSGAGSMQRREPALDEAADGPGVAPRDGACPDIPLLFSRNLEGDVPADLCARLEGHVAGCSRCRAECDSLEATLALCRQSRDASEVRPLDAAAREAIAAAVRS